MEIGPKDMGPASETIIISPIDAGNFWFQRRNWSAKANHLQRSILNYSPKLGPINNLCHYSPALFYPCVPADDSIVEDISALISAYLEQRQLSWSCKMTRQGEMCKVRASLGLCLLY